MRHQLIHPQINAILGSAGHHATILIADGNYPASSKKGLNGEVISLNLMPGVVTCNQVLQAILSAIPVESIQTMIRDQWALCLPRIHRFGPNIARRFSGPN
ncbi:MAG: RbsD/FucU domain-containing protein [Pirellulaceae bacterium]